MTLPFSNHHSPNEGPCVARSYQSRSWLRNALLLVPLLATSGLAQPTADGGLRDSTLMVDSVVRALPSDEEERGLPAPLEVTDSPETTRDSVERVGADDAPPSRDGEVGFLILLATIVGPILATLLALWGQRKIEARKEKERAVCVRRAIHREIEANLRTTDAVWDRVGIRSSRAAERLGAARRLGRQELPVWEREAYNSLLAELPDAVARPETMALTADHYALLRRMDWSHRQLREAERQGAQAGDVAGDQRLATWAAYAEAHDRLVEIGNPLDEPDTSL